MKRVKMTTTIRLLRDHQRLGLLELHLGKNYGVDTPVNLLLILKMYDPGTCMWAFRAAEQPYSIVKPILVSIACEMVESVLHIVEGHPDYDGNAHKAVAAARAVVADETAQTLKDAYSAYAAAVSSGLKASGVVCPVDFAASGAAKSAFWEDIDNVANVAHVAHEAAFAAARATHPGLSGQSAIEKRKQGRIIRKYLGGA